MNNKEILDENTWQTIIEQIGNSNNISSNYYDYFLKDLQVIGIRNEVEIYTHMDCGVSKFFLNKYCRKDFEEALSELFNIPTSVRFTDDYDKEAEEERERKLKKYNMTGCCKDEADLTFKVGTNEKGEIVSANLKELHSLIVAGCIGSGVNEFLDEMIMGFLRNSNSDLQMMLFDPLIVNLNKFNEIKNLQRPIINTPDEAIEALEWCVKEINERYAKFADLVVRDIDSYNSHCSSGIDYPEMVKYNHHHLPRIVVFIEELMDYMLNYKERVEEAIIRIAQLGKSAGIHIVIATTNPSEDVITDVINANVSSKIAFRTRNEIDSKQIINMNGAEKLIDGEMLFFSPLFIQATQFDRDM